MLQGRFFVDADKWKSAGGKSAGPAGRYSAVTAQKGGKIVLVKKVRGLASQYSLYLTGSKPKMVIHGRPHPRKLFRPEGDSFTPSDDPAGWTRRADYQFLLCPT